MKLSPALAYLASNPWAMEFELFGRLADLVAAHAAGEHVDAETVAAFKAAAAAPATAGAEPGVQWIGRTAVVPIRGVVARYASSVNGVCQPQGRSAEAIQSDLMAVAERSPERVILRIDSPGGEVAGTAETAAMVRHLSASGIPVIAYVDGLAASAAYWIASQADEIVASSDTAKVGSIGVALSMGGSGGRQTVITSAPAKSSPVINDAHLANARTIVVDLATAFADAVASGRELTADQASALATGEVWTAQRALALGLVDRIASWDQLTGKAGEDTAKPDHQRRQAIATKLSATVTTTQPAAPAAASTAPSASTQPAVADLPTTPQPEKAPMTDIKLLAALAVMAAAHPTHAEALSAEASKPGASVASLEAFIAPIAAKAKEQAHAAEVADLKAKLATAEKAATDEKARADKATGDLARAQAHGTPHGDLGGDQNAKGPKPKFTKAQMAGGQIPADVVASGHYELSD
jgi:capsid assembly protease